MLEGCDARMIVITVARKPLNGTVANNALKYGTGGINIDVCRVGCTRPGAHAGSYQTWRELEGRRDVPQESRDPDTAKGRFPANLILQHLDGCKCTGTKEVKPSNGSGKATDPEGQLEVKNQMYGKRKCQGNIRGFTDPESGKETVPAWDCLPGCPVADLDKQSNSLGMHSAGSFRNNPDKMSDSRGLFPGWTGGNGNRVGDIGGASRFFKQIQDTGSNLEPKDPHA